MIRFRLHTQYIKHFNFDGNEADFNWDSLAQIATKAELLPNLVTLCSCSQSNPDTVSIFLSRSTQKISISGELRPIYAANLMQRAACISPGILELELCPHQPDIASTLDLGLEQLPQVAHGYASLSKLSNLCALVLTPPMLEPPILKLIARLPNLSSLKIMPYQYRECFECSLSTRLPEDSFPALSVLHVPFASSRGVKRFWDFVPLTKLKNLSMYIESISNNSLAFIATLCQASPLITQLELTFPGQSNGDGERGPYMIGQGAFEHLSGLPLDCIFSLCGAMFEFHGAWTRIVNSWNGLTNINCTYQPTNLDDLIFLSSNLPKLGSISCDFDLEGAVRTVEHNWMPIRTLPFHPCLKVLDLKQFKLTTEVTASDKYNLSDLA
ncbi:hypothetical protein FRC09_011838, partial [Ceratobasidium sp. 395]